MRLGPALLEREGLVVRRITSTCAEAVDLKIAENETDVVLLDLGLPDASGPEAVSRIRQVSSSLPIIAFSVERTPEVIRAVLRAGRERFCLQGRPVEPGDRRARSGGPGADRPSARPRLGPISRMAEGMPAADATEEASDVEVNESEPGAAVPVREPSRLGSSSSFVTWRRATPIRRSRARWCWPRTTVKKGVQTLIAKLGAPIGPMRSSSRYGVT